MLQGLWVSELIDGDTFRGNGLTVRLADVDCPELWQTSGQAAKDHPSRLILRKQVSYEAKAIDPYKRAIAQVRLDGTDVNAEMRRFCGDKS